MTIENPTCIVCGRDDTQVPLLRFSSRGSELAICSEHMPILIHDPDRLVGKLPGAEDLSPAESST
jgi:hypothetical protein